MFDGLGRKGRAFGGRGRWRRHGAAPGRGVGGADVAQGPGEHEPEPGHQQGHAHGHGGGAGRGLGRGHGRGRGRNRGGPEAAFEGPSLNDIGTGGLCRVVALHGRGPVRQRLMDLGLVPNARLQVVRSAPLDDPVEVRIEDTFLTLRRAEAAHVQVTDV
ncbi:FeoA family protein [Rhodospira trueperi]|uniref:Fe2+ transport system protein FeoA n=1 Tax=Rhodospira trueperi TaxID=69960 RepID=A0A1G6Z7I9_9PROT|nr:FeoA family protein [Rhodospira trueperi]SDD98649.1 Fe2+ transport system protein FeoA [Rhodospira trueperi]